MTIQSELMVVAEITVKRTRGDRCRNMVLACIRDIEAMDRTTYIEASRRWSILDADGHYTLAKQITNSIYKIISDTKISPSFPGGAMLNICDRLDLPEKYFTHTRSK